MGSSSYFLFVKIGEPFFLCDAVFALALTLLIIDIKIPSWENINSTNDLWLSLKHLFPQLYWVNIF
jgi:uncharacterized membrane protein